MFKTNYQVVKLLKTQRNSIITKVEKKHVLFFIVNVNRIFDFEVWFVALHFVDWYYEGIIGIYQ